MRYSKEQMDWMIEDYNRIDSEEAHRDLVCAECRGPAQGYHRRFMGGVARFTVWCKDPNCGITGDAKVKMPEKGPKIEGGARRTRRIDAADFTTRNTWREMFDDMYDEFYGLVEIQIHGLPGDIKRVTITPIDNED